MLKHEHANYIWPEPSAILKRQSQISYVKLPRKKNTNWMMSRETSIIKQTENNLRKSYISVISALLTSTILFIKKMCIHENMLKYYFNTTSCHANIDLKRKLILMTVVIKYLYKCRWISYFILQAMHSNFTTSFLFTFLNMLYQDMYINNTSVWRLFYLNVAIYY